MGGGLRARAFIQIIEIRVRVQVFDIIKRNLRLGGEHTLKDFLSPQKASLRVI